MSRIFDKVQQLKKEKQQCQAAKAIQDQSLSKKDKSHLKCFSTPGLSQAQVMASVGHIQNDSESFGAIMGGIAERLQKGDNQDVEMILNSQIAMLNSLAAHFMIKALGGYDSPQVLQSLPQLPLEFANLSLKCQTEMRRCIELLHDLKNPKKPSQFIKTFVNQQLNQLHVEQQELRERLEATHYAQMDTSSAREAEPNDTELEALGVEHGTKNGTGEAG